MKKVCLVLAILVLGVLPAASAPIIINGGGSSYRNDFRRICEDLAQLLYLFDGRERLAVGMVYDNNRCHRFNAIENVQAETEAQKAAAVCDRMRLRLGDETVELSLRQQLAESFRRLCMDPAP